MGAFEDYLGLVDRLGTGEINRSENDLSSNLKDALTSFGLYGVIDTGSGSNRIKRPDIALYVDLAAADVSSPADVIIESKKPGEVAGFGNLSEALADDELWHDKFVPYVRAHANLASYFVLTTFERFLILPISTRLRLAVQRDGSFPDRLSRQTLLASARSFDLRQAGQAMAFKVWYADHLTPETLIPPPLSSILDIRTLRGTDALEDFASALADVVVGPEGHPTPGGALIATINIAGHSLDDLEAAARRALVVYTMAANGGLTVEGAQAYLSRHLQDELAEFISASVHSLVGRLFAIKAIEDGFCVGTVPPLIEPAEWVFHSEKFDRVPLDGFHCPSSPRSADLLRLAIQRSGTWRLRAVFTTGLHRRWIQRRSGAWSRYFSRTTSGISMGIFSGVSSNSMRSASTVGVGSSLVNITRRCPSCDTCGAFLWISPGSATLSMSCSYSIQGWDLALS